MSKQENERLTPAVWFLAIRVGTGSDVFTQRLCDALKSRGIRSEITWLPHRAEYLPWSVRIPTPPEWASVVHINTWMHRRFIPIDLPVVATLHFWVHDESLSSYKNFFQAIYHRCWIKRLELSVMRRAEILSAVSNYTAMKAQQSYPHKRIHPIHNWVDTTKFLPKKTERDECRRFKLLFVGNVSHRKGADLLVDIMRCLGDKYELHYTGYPREFPSSKRPLPKNMIALGRVDNEKELPDIYRDSDILLFPTRLEGFGLVAVEALASGLPVVSTKCSSLPEIVEDGVSGFLCPINDAFSMASLVRMLSRSPELMERMKKKARERAVVFFSEEQAVSRYVEIYLSLVNAKVDSVSSS